MAAVDEIVRLLIEYTVPGASQCLNAFQWIIDSAVSDSDTHQDMVDWVTDEWGPEWDDLANNGAEIIKASTEVIEWDGDKIVVVRNLGSDTLSIPGTVATDQMPGGVSASIFAATGRPKTRGRKSIPGLGDSSILGGYFTGTVLGDLAVLLVKYFLEWADGTGGGQYIPGVISTVDGLWYPFEQGGGFDDRPDYQRSRKPDSGS